MAGFPKIRIIEDTTVSTEQYHIDLTGAKHRVREADELRSNKSAQQTRGAPAAQSVTTQADTACASSGLWVLLYLVRSLLRHAQPSSRRVPYP